jgi:hypothetical protein
VTTRGGVGQVDRDLGVLDPSGNRIGVAELPHDVVAQVIPDAVGVPAGPREQVLHPMRIALTSVLGDRPAVLPRQVGQQPEHEPADPPAALHPRKPGGHPIEQPGGLRVPRPGIYAVARGHRLIFRSRHNGR